MAFLPPNLQNSLNLTSNVSSIHAQLLRDLLRSVYVVYGLVLRRCQQYCGLPREFTRD